MNAEKILAWPVRDTGGVEYGTIRQEDDGAYKVHGPSGIFTANAAFSCLVKPLSGDKVMYAQDSEGRCYILAVLERPTSTNAVLSFPGNVALESTGGHVIISARSGIEFSTREELNLTASDLNLSAATARLNVVDLQATGESFIGNMTRARFLSDTVDLVAARVTQRAKSVFRWIDEVEQVSAGQMIQRVRTLFSVRSRHSSISAESDVKINGSRVHLG